MHGSEYDMANIFLVSYFAYIKENMGNKENINQIVQDKGAISSLSLTSKICAFC